MLAASAAFREKLAESHLLTVATVYNHPGGKGGGNTLKRMNRTLREPMEGTIGTAMLQEKGRTGDAIVHVGYFVHRANSLEGSES